MVFALLKRIVIDQELEQIISDFNLKDYAKSDDIENIKQLPTKCKYFLSIIISIWIIIILLIYHLW